MANHVSDKRIRHYTLEILGIGCGIHEVRILYPELEQVLSYIPHFQYMYQTIMVLLFVGTVIVWFGYGVSRLWSQLVPGTGLRISPESTPPLTTRKSRTLTGRADLAGYSHGVVARIGDVQLHGNNLVGALNELSDTLMNDEQQRRITHIPLEPEVASPAELAQLHEAIEHAEASLYVCVAEFQTFLSADVKRT
jgi:hypothetical protein